MFYQIINFFYLFFIGVIYYYNELFIYKFNYFLKINEIWFGFGR